MVQHITIIPKEGNPTQPDANPYKVLLWRDDQTIKWGLAANWCWPEGLADPIRFLPADPSRGYLDWPGSKPVPIGPPPAPGTPDRRYYTASSDKVLDPSAPPELYHYMYAVCPVENPNCPLELQENAREAPRSQQWKDRHGRWHDPEAENQPQP